MTMFRYGRALTLIALLIAVGVAGASVAIAGGSEELFAQAASAADLKAARGVVYDLTLSPAWVISGEWTLDCGGQACEVADFNKIKFDLAHVMVKPNGNLSHSHTYRDFIATGVNVIGDDLTIVGTITGSGPIKSNPIVIELVDVNFNQDFSIFQFELPGNPHLVGVIGGVIVESED